MRMHVLSGGRLRMRKNIYFPDADRSEVVDMPVSCILLRHPKGNVLFDTGCHPDVAVDPERRWGAMTRFMTPTMAPGDNVLTSLKAVGLGSDDISVVICSHLHPDHCGCNQFFRKATIHVHALELAAARAPDAPAAGFLPDDWDHPIPMKTVDGETDLFGDGRIRLLPLPGHTPGTMGVLARLDKSGQQLLASDAVSIRANLDRNVVPKNTWNKELYLQSFQRIREIEAAGAKVICGHDAAQFDTLRTGADFYE